MTQAMAFSRAVRTALLGFCLLVAASPAWAQGEGEAAVVPDADVISEVSAIGAAPDVDEITVVGLRSNVTNVQDEASAITAFGMDDLDRAEIANVDKLAFNVPNLHIGQTGSDSIVTLRGVSTENATITGEPGIQFHVDGLNYARPSAARLAFFDLEGLQVLRGPQGFKGGKNSTAGHIAVTTAKPRAVFESKLEYQVGSYNQRRSRGHVNIPVNEYVQTRFAFVQEDRDGFQENLIGTMEFGDTRIQVPNDEDHDAMDADDFGFRGHLKLLPTESLEALFSYNYYKQDGVGPWSELQSLPQYGSCTSLHPEYAAGVAAGFGGVPTNFPAFYACRTKRIGFVDRFTPILEATPARDEGTSTSPNSLFKNRVSSQENRFWGWSADFDYEMPSLGFLGDTQLKSISGYQVTRTFADGDRDASELDVFWGSTEKDSRQWSSELQWLGSSPEGLLDWQLSLFYLHEHSDALVDVDARFGVIQRVFIDQEVDNKSYGVGLNTNWHATDTLRFNLAGRYVHDRKKNALLRLNPEGLRQQLGSEASSCRGPEPERVIPRFDPFNPSPTPPLFLPGGTPECQANFRQLVGAVGVEWDPLEALPSWPGEEALLYANVSNGFKSGGFAAFETGTYDPEKIWSFSVGAKNKLFDDRLTLNVEGFWYNYRDMQLVVVDGLSVRTDNADTEMSGLELEFEAQPFAGFNLSGNFSYMDTEVTEYFAYDPVDVRNASNCKKNQAENGGELECIESSWEGNELSRAPKLSYKISAEYEFYLGEYGVLTPRIQYYWQDDTWYRTFNRTPQNTGPGEFPILPKNKSGDSIVNDLQEGYHFTDLKLTWTSPQDKFHLEAFVLNLEDNSVYQNVQIGSSVLANPGFAWYGPPRTYGFRLGFTY